MLMGLRKQIRLQLVLPVRISGWNDACEPFEQDCKTVDLTNDGVRVQGLKRLLQRGALVNITYGGKSAPARVMWIEKTGQAGLQVIDGWKNFWGRTIPQIPGDGFSQSAYNSEAKSQAKPENTPKVRPEANPGARSELTGNLAAAGPSALDTSPLETVQDQAHFVNFLTRTDLLQRMSREPRLKLQLPVRVFGMSRVGRPYVENAITESISRYGVSLSGLSYELQRKELLILAHQGRKGPFRVIWSRRHDTRPMFEAGLRALETGRSIWRIDFSGVTRDECGPVERRVAHRYVCTGGISIYHPSTKHFMRGTVADLSLSGCYVEIMAPLNAHEKAALVLTVGDVEVRATAEVRTSHPGMGMGLKFKDLAESDKANLRTLISRLGHSTTGETPELDEARLRKEIETLDKNEAPQPEYEKRRNGYGSNQ